MLLRVGGVRDSNALARASEPPTLPGGVRRHAQKIDMQACIAYSVPETQVLMGWINVLEAFSGVLRTLTDPGQAIIGSRAEAACLRAFAALERDVANTALDEGEYSLDELSTMADTFRDVPVEVVTGRTGTRASIDMMCWVAASSLSDGVRTPYLTARTLANLGFHKASDEPSIVSRMDEPALRFEDEAGERPALSALIRAEADRYLTGTTPRSWIATAGRPPRSVPCPGDFDDE
jgi:hypothetical protein